MMKNGGYAIHWVLVLEVTYCMVLITVAVIEYVVEKPR
jgi:hypothetical protein